MSQDFLRATLHDGPVTGKPPDGVGGVHDAFQSVFGQHHRQSDVMDERGDGGKNVLGCGGIQRTGGFVEDEDARLGCKYSGDGHPLLLAA